MKHHRKLFRLWRLLAAVLGWVGLGHATPAALGQMISVSLPPSAVGGQVAVTGVVTLPFATSSDLTVNLTSGDATHAAVPASVTVSAGADAANFTITFPAQTQLSWAETVGISAAASGYQTGQGSIMVQSAEAATLLVTPSVPYSAAFFSGGYPTPTSETYTLSNTGNVSLNWTATKTVSWLSLSSASGALAPGASTTVTATLTSAANSLPGGPGGVVYSDTISFTNTTSGSGNTAIPLTLTVSGVPTMGVSTGGLAASGPVGGAFSPSSASFTVTNTGSAPLTWAASTSASWNSLSTTGGTLNPRASATVVLALTSAANNLAAGSYTDTVVFTNSSTGDGNTTAPITLTVGAASAASLSITPASNITSSGNVGGPFSSASTAYTLTNTGGSTMKWAASNSSSWLTLSPTDGALGPGANVTVNATINSAADNLVAAAYTDAIAFTNTTNGNGNATKSVTLTVTSSTAAAMSVSPTGGLSSSGAVGGAFSPAARIFTVTSSGGAALSWTASNTSAWLTVAPAGGTLAPGESAAVAATINSAAGNLAAGSYADSIAFTNVTNGAGNTSSPVSLTVAAAAGTMGVTPATGITSSGNTGGPFSAPATVYTIANLGNTAMDWSASNTTAWLTLSPASGTIPAGGSATVTATISSSANSLAAGKYTDAISFTNTDSGLGSTTRPVFLSVTTGGTWTRVAQLAPGGICQMLLLTDGSVIAHDSGSLAAWYRLTPDATGSYINGTWTTLAPMHDTRLYGASQILLDGRLFIAGGEDGIGSRTGEVYDPVANFWTMAPPSGQQFVDSASQLLGNGTVLIEPVDPAVSGNTEIYNPATNTWITGPKLVHGNNEDEATWVKLPDDSILTIDSEATTAERYIPSLNQWVADTTVPEAIYNSSEGEMGPGFLLPNGQALFLGGNGNTAYYSPTGTNSPGSWTDGPAIPGGLGINDGSGAMMVTGQILFVAGPATSYDPPTSFFLFDYTTNTFTTVNSPDVGTNYSAPYETNMLCLPDGTVLFTQFGTPLYVYQPTGPPLAAGTPTITSVTPNADGSFHLVGTLLNGLCEGACYGDDFQMATNYPIVSLISSSGSVYHGRVFNRGSASVMTGTKPLSADFTLPAGLPAGAYSLTVSANGNVSAPLPISFSPMVVTLAASASEAQPPLTGTVMLPSAPSASVTVNLVSSNPARAAVQSSVTVPAGQTSANFTLTPVNDAILNGDQPVTISASAAGYQAGQTVIVIQDDESAVLTITPLTSFNPSGAPGGPFSPSSATYTLSNAGNVPLTWAAYNGSPLTFLSSSSGTLAAGASTAVTLSLASGADGSLTGTSTNALIFDNTTSGVGDLALNINLTITGTPAVSVSGSSFSASGDVGGPFSPRLATYLVSNPGTAPVFWSASTKSAWNTVSPAGGSLYPGGSVPVTLSLNSAANGLAVGSYSDTLTISNTSALPATSTTYPVAVTVGASVAAMTVTPSGGFASSGFPGGPFSPFAAIYTIQNTSNVPLSWTAGHSSNWLTLAPTSGALGAGASINVTASLTATANTLAGGAYADSISFTNTQNGAGNTASAVSLGVIPAVPTLSVPAFSQGASAALTWNASVGASSYDIQIASTSDFATPLATQSPTIPGAVFNNLANGAVYFYRVRADAGSASSAWSAVVSSTQDATPPLVSVTKPASGLSTTQSTVTLQGGASDAISGVSSVSVNGVAAVSANGFATWTASSIPLSLGANTLTALAADNAQPSANTAAAAITLSRVADTTGDGLPDSWKIRYGLNPNSSTGNNGLLGNPAGDGLPNLLKYAFGLNPNLGEPTPVQASLQVSPVDGQTYLNVQFVERTDTIDLTYVIQLSSDLLTWSPAAPLTQLSATPNADGVTQTVAFQVGPSISSGSAALFTRISVTVP